MLTVNIHQAKTHLSRLLDQVAAGDSVVIAKAGKPIAKLVPVNAAPVRKQQRIGSMKGQFKAPDDFDTLMAKEMEEMFYGSGKL
jgi:prevent-host-death family protein